LWCIMASILAFLTLISIGALLASAEELWVQRSPRSFTEHDINLILPGIYVGDQYAAGDIDHLVSNLNISAILNVAWDLDIRYPAQEYVGDMDDNNEHVRVQYSKIGLVDAAGNKMSTLAAAVLTLDQFLSPRDLLEKDQKTFPPVQNVLVHCHSGQSRSVTIASLYIYFRHRDQFPTYIDALTFVKKQRNLSTNHNVPRPELTVLAENLAKLDLFKIFRDIGN